MKTNLIVIISYLLLFVLILCSYGADIQITELREDYIAGFVKGLSNNQQYKVVVYAKVPGGWTKQPYPGYKENYSWASIREDGFWSLGLRKRFSQKMGFTDKIAVLVMKKSGWASDRLETFKGTDYFLIKILEL